MDKCVICERVRNDDSLVVCETPDWIVRHSRETNIPGYVLIESRRHYLDLADATDAESASLGPLMKSVISAVRAVTKPERVYTVTLAEAVPHMHIHVIPRTQAVPRAYRGRGILAYPLQPSVDSALLNEVCLSLRRRLRNLVPQQESACTHN